MWSAPTVGSVTEDQLSLFPDLTGGAKSCGSGRNPGKTFLSKNSNIFESLLSSETLRKCAAAAASHVSKKHGDTRDTGVKFEDRFCELILEPDNARSVSEETIAFASDNFPGLHLVKAELACGPKREKTLSDIVLNARCEKERTISVSVNIKRLKPDASSTEGGSTLQFLQLATERNYDPSNPPSPVGFDHYKAILEMLAERRRIQDGRDYWLLVARVNSGKLEGLEAWGTMVGTRHGQPLLTRHVNRAVVNVHQPDGMLDPDVDPNITIANALLPAGGMSAVRAHITAALRDEYGTDRAAEAAAKLLDLDDRLLLELLSKSLSL